MSGDFAEVYLASHHYHLSFHPEQFAHGGPVAQRRLKQPLVYSAEYDAMRGPMASRELRRPSSKPLM
jgi:hypothetical protein